MSQNNFVRTVGGRPDGLILAKDETLVTPLLRRLLGLCTPNGTEHHVVDVIRSQPYIKAHKRWVDPEKGNYVVQVGSSRSIFSCHMDIVGSNHKSMLEKNRVEKIFLFTPEDTVVNGTNYGMVWGAKGLVDEKGVIAKYEPSTLGADDKVGVYILLRMIEKGIPGTYLFHTGEECGGLGSAYLASKHPEIFENKDRAIAFDRAGYDDVIGYQRGGRCCSTDFGKALAAALNVSMPPRIKFKEDAHGTFTDTANYTKLVPECTNVSVGYFNQHGSSEHLDAYWLETWLLPAILNVKYEELPTKRDPKEVPQSSYSYSNWQNKSANTPKKEWKDTTVKTPYLEFPLWKPELGIPEGANRDALIMAMGRYLSNVKYGKERDALCDWIISKLEYINLLEEDNITLNSVIGRLTGNDRANPPDVILLPPPDDYKKEETVSIDLNEKLGLLNRLIIAGDVVLLPRDEDEKWLRTLANGAKKTLKKIGDKETISSKQLRKLNKLMFEMLYLIDEALVLSKTEEMLLLEVEKHILDNADQPGWWLGKSDQASTIH